MSAPRLRATPGWREVALEINNNLYPRDDQTTAFGGRHIASLSTPPSRLSLLRRGPVAREAPRDSPGGTELLFPVQYFLRS